MKHLDQTTAALLAGITSRRLRQIETEPFVVDPPPREEAGYPTKPFGDWLRRRALAEVVVTDTGEALSLDAQRARLARAQADLTELRVGEAAGELLKVSDVEAEWSRMLGAVRQRLLAIPTRVAPLVSAESNLAVIAEVVEAAVVEALAELSSEGSDES